MTEKAEEKREQINEQVSNVLKGYSYAHPFPTEVWILCSRWIEGGKDAQSSYDAFLKIARRYHARAEDKRISALNVYPQD